MEKGGEIGAEEQGRPRRSYCIVNYRFSEKEIPDWSAACQSVNKHLSPSPFPPPSPAKKKKTSQSQRSPIFTVAQTFVPRDEQTALQFPNGNRGLQGSL